MAGLSGAGTEPGLGLSDTQDSPVRIAIVAGEIRKVLSVITKRRHFAKAVCFTLCPRRSVFDREKSDYREAVCVNDFECRSSRSGSRAFAHDGDTVVPNGEDGSMSVLPAIRLWLDIAIETGLPHQADEPFVDTAVHDDVVAIILARVL